MKPPKDKPDSNLSDLGQSVEKCLVAMMADASWKILKFEERMLVLDRALKLEAIKKKAAGDEEGAWFRDMGRYDDDPAPGGFPQLEKDDA